MTQIKKKVKIKQKQSTKKNSWLKRRFKRIAIILIALVVVVLVAIFIPKIIGDSGNGTDVVVADDTTKNDSVMAPKTEDNSTNEDSSKMKGASKVEEEVPMNKGANKGEEKPKTQSLPVVSDENKSDVKVGEDAKSNYVSFSESTATNDTETEALSVIRGKYGNNPDRRRLLKDRYQEIQSRVNEMYRNGEVR